MPSRFLTLDGADDVLSVFRSQAYALVRRGELRAIKVGGRGVWRVERVELEAFIAAAYTATRDCGADVYEDPGDPDRDAAGSEPRRRRRRPVTPGAGRGPTLRGAGSQAPRGNTRLGTTR